MARMTNTSFMTGIKNWVLGKIANIMALIPNQASSSNQLADKNFVNSSIATATATFRGTYNVVSDLSLSYNATHAQIEAALAMKMTALSIVADNNDYAFVQIPTSDATPTEIAMIEKYKFNGSAWAFEYELNNSGFTAEQWAAINSGATLELIGKLSALPTNAELTTILNGKASKAANATTGHFASLDANGNPTDSGISLEDNGAYDVTAHNSGAKFADLSALLSNVNLNTLIPIAVRKGGMSIKFVQSSDNKYVQARCMAQNFTTDTTQWQGVDNEPTAASNNLVKSGGVAKELQGINLYLEGLSHNVATIEGVAYYNVFDIYINAGTKFTVTPLGVSGLIDRDLFGSLIFTKEDDSQVSLGSISIGEEREFTLDYTIKSMMISRGASGVIGSGDITLYVKAISKDIEELQEDVNDIQDEVSEFDSKVDKINNMLDGNLTYELFNNPVSDLYYQSNLADGYSSAFVGQLIDLTTFNKVKIYSKLRGVAAISITDNNRNILWQIDNDNQPADGISIVDLTQLQGTASKLYFTDCIELLPQSDCYVKGEKQAPSYPEIISDVLENKEDIDELQESVNEYMNMSSKFFANIKPNNFDSDNIVTLPSEFSPEYFRIPIQISKSGNVFGWNLINQKVLQKNNSNTATYFVSPSGNDSNSGLTAQLPLKTIQAALNKSDVNTVILLKGTYICGEHFTSGLEVTKVLNIIGIGYVELQCTSAQSPLHIKEACYVENIVFNGGTAALNVTLTDQLCIFIRCKFLNSSSVNGFNAIGGDYYMEECEASGNRRDGLNYHANSGYLPHVIEINCCGFYNGINDTNYINNGSTMHDNGKIIRLFCEYAFSRGGVVADADGAKSLNIGVISYSTQNLDGIDANDYKKCNFGAQNSGVKMYLINCASFGSKYDCVAENACTIYRNSQFQREETVGTGVIESYDLQ